MGIEKLKKSDFVVPENIYTSPTDGFLP